MKNITSLPKMLQFKNIPVFLLLLFSFTSVFSQEVVINKSVVQSTTVCNQYDVTLEIIGDPIVPKPQEVILVIDKSGSMGRGEAPTAIDFAKDAAIDFVQQMFTPEHNPTGLNRVSVISYSTTSYLNIALTNSSGEQAILDAINNITTGGNTNIAGALNLADQQFANNATFDCGTTRSIVLLTDGVANIDANGTLCNDETDPNSSCVQDAIQAGVDAQTTTIDGEVFEQRIFSIGLFNLVAGTVFEPIAENTLDQIQNAGTYITEDAIDLTSIYDSIINELDFVATQLPGQPIVKSTLTGGFDLIPGTLVASKGTASFDDQVISWFIEQIVEETVTLTYTIAAIENTVCGIQDPGTSVINYKDSNCQEISRVFNSPEVCVPCPIVAPLEVDRESCSNTVNYSTSVSPGGCDPVSGEFSWNFFLNDTLVGSSDTESGTFTYSGSEVFEGDFRADFTYIGTYGNGCDLPEVSTSRIITIDSTPEPPTSTGDITECEEDPIQTLNANDAITATAGQTVVWYDAPTGGSVVANPILNTVGSITYYAEGSTSADACSSATRTSVALTINPAASAPISTGDITECEESPIQTLDANDAITATSGQTVVWYDAATGGNVVANPTLNTKGNITYYAEASTNEGGCTSFSRTSVALAIVEAPEAPTSTGDITECEESPIQTLDANDAITPISGQTVVWYDAATGGNVVANPTLNTVSSVTYYAEANTDAGGCPSATRTSVALTITEAPAAPISTGDITECEENPIQTLNANDAITATAGQSVVWYDASTGGTVVSNPTLNTVGSITYYAEAVTNSDSCSSLTRTPVVLTIDPAATAPTSTGDITECEESPIQTLDANDAITPTPGQTVVWYDASTGGSVVANPTLNTVGSITYYAEAMPNSGTCPGFTRTPVALTINPAAEIPTSTGDITECEESPIQTLNANDAITATAGQSVVWYNAPIGGDVVNNPTLNAVGSITYYAQGVTNSDSCPSTERASVVLTIDTAAAPPTSTGDITECEENPTQTLNANDAVSVPSGQTVVWYDAATGGNVVANPTLNTVGNVTYYAEAMSSSGACPSATRTSVALAIIEVPAAPTSTGDITECEESPIQTLNANDAITATSGQTIVWYDASTGGNVVANPTLNTVGNITYYAEAITNVGGCSSATRTSVALAIIEAPAAPTSTGDITECEESPIQTLDANDAITPMAGQTIMWYNAPTGGTLVANPTLNTVGSITYYAEAMSSSGECPSATRTSVTLTIFEAPAAPTSTGHITECEEDPIQTLDANDAITLAPGQTVVWYDAPTGGNEVANPILNVVGTVTYYAEANTNSGGCTSNERTEVILTINPAADAPTSTGHITECEESPIQTLNANDAITATAGQSVVWYDAPTGGSVVNNPTLNTVGSVTYYAEGVTNSDNCSSLTRTSVTLTINPGAEAPISTGDITECEEDPIQTLNANDAITATSGQSVVWYDAPTGGNEVSNPILNTVGSVTYYAEGMSSSGACPGVARTSVTLTINPAAEAPISTGDITECEESPIQTLNANDAITATSGQTVVWYDALTGGNVVPNPILNSVSSVTYYAEGITNNDNCPSLYRTPVKLTIDSAAEAPISSGDITECEEDPIQTLDANDAITVPSGQSVVWYNAPIGGSVVNNPTLNTIGSVTYYAEAMSSSGACPSATRTSVVLTITESPAAPISTGDITECEENPIQTLNANDAITATSGQSVVWYDASTGGNVVANPILNTVGNVTYYGEASTNAGGCRSVTRTSVALTIIEAPIAPKSTGDITECEESPIQTLNANDAITATPGQSVVWYNASTGGSVVNNPILNTVGSITYYAEGVTNSDSCSSLTRTSVTLTIDPAATAPISTGDISECEESPIQTLDANDAITATSGQTVVWYDAPTGGNVVANPILNSVGSITYYAEAMPNSGTSCPGVDRTSVALTIDSAPAAPISTGDIAECEESPIQTLNANDAITATAGQSVVWYDAPTGGSVVANPTLNTVGSVTYYGEASTNAGDCRSTTRTSVALTIDSAPAAPVSSGDITECEEDPIQTLDANDAVTVPSGETVVWYDAPTGGSVVNNPTLNTVGSVTYYAEAMSSSGICPGVSRTSVTLTIDSAPSAPISTGDITECEESPIQTLNANDAITATSGQNVVWYDSSTGGNVVANPTLNTVGSITYYAESISNAGGCPSGNRTSVALTINPAATAPISSGDIIECEEDPLQTLDANDAITVASGNSVVWYDAATGGNVVANPTLNTIGNITYFAETMPNSGACPSATRTSVTLAIIQALTSTGDITECEEDPIQTLDANDAITPASGQTVVWYDAPTGGNVVANPILNTVGSITYYAEAMSSSGTCPGVSRTSVTLTIIQSPAAPTNGGDITECEEDPIQTLNANDAIIPTAGQTVVWYDAPTGGNVVANPILNTVGNVTYYGESSTISGECTSDNRTSISLAIIGAPEPPISTGDIAECEENPVQTLNANDAITATPGQTVVWYDAPTGGNIVTNPISNTVGSVTYYAQSQEENFDIGICVSLTRTPVTLTIIEAPEAPTSTGDITECEEDPIQTLDANDAITATSGQTVVWYDASTGGNVVNDPTLNTVGSVTYYGEARTNADGCPSLDRTPVVLTIIEAPAAPISSGDITECEEDPIQTLNANDAITATAGQTVVWYDAPTGGNVVANPTLNTVGSVTYYAEGVTNSDSCPSLDRTSVTLTIDPAAEAPISSGDITEDEEDPIQTLNANDAIVATAGQTVVWYDAPTGGNVVANPILNELGSITYYAEGLTTGSNCPSLNRTPVTLTINPVNTTDAINDINDTFINLSVSGNVLTNDEDLQSDIQTVTTTGTITTAQGGTVVLNSDGSYTYTPPVDFTGEDTFEYSITDDGNPMMVDTATVTIQVLPVDTTNNTTIANDDIAGTEINVPVIGNVLVNDIDIEGDIQSVTNVGTFTTTQDGSITIAANGSFTYTPPVDFTGEDTFEYFIEDDNLNIATDSAILTITVDDDPDNDINRTYANDDAYIGIPGATINGNVSDNDSDPEGDDQIVATTPVVAPLNGTVTLNSDGSFIYIPTDPTFTGTDQFVYSVCDTGSPQACDEATVYITIGGEPNTTDAIDDINDTLVNTPVSGNVLTNDEDLQGDEQTVTTTGTIPTAEGGSVVLNADGSYTYTPLPGFVGTDSFQYSIIDDGNPQATDTANVVIEVRDGNGPNSTIANNDIATTELNTSVLGNVLVNDIDLEGDDQIVTTVGTFPTDQGGSIVIAADGTFTYTPPADFTGEDTFTYNIEDDNINQATDSAVLTITVNPAQLNTTDANDDAYAGNQGGIITGNVSDNDNDQQGDNQIVNTTPVSGPTNGTVVLNADGSFTYTPNDPNFSGPDSFVYSVCDDGSPVACDEATVSIIIFGINTTDAILDINNTYIDLAVEGNVLTNDEDAQGDVQMVTTVGTFPTTEGGSITIAADGSYTYTPPAGFTGEDTFTYAIIDDGNPTATDSAILYIEVLPLDDPSNQPPVANPDTASTEINTSVTGTVIVNDYDTDGDNILVTTTTVTTTEGVVVTIDPITGIYTYTPPTDFVGVDTFTYTICDDGIPSLCDDTIVEITVIDVNDEDNNTFANDDAYNGNPGEDIIGNVSDNDSDPENDNQTVATTPVIAPLNGTVVLQPDGNFVYTPTDPTFVGTDQFVYSVCDDGTPQACDTATVYITIGEDNNTIFAIDDINDTFVNITVTGDVSTNDDNLDGPAGTETFTLVSGPTAGGTLVFNADGTYTYTPLTDYVGEDTFVYQICDAGSPVACDTATVTIEVVNDPLIGNDPPIANNDTAVTEINIPVTGNVLVNDYDLDGDQITVTTTTVTTNQGVTVTIDPITGVYTYTPPTNYVGDDFFTYTICDNGNPVLCDDAIVYITVIGNDANITVANDDSYYGEIATTITGNVLTNDTDPENDNQSVTSVTVTSLNGVTVTINPDGTFNYTAPVGFTGTDQFIYTITDDNAAGFATDQATVYILIEQTPAPAITIVKTAEYDPIVNGECTSAVGDIITYTFSVTNTGNVDLTGVTVTDPLFEAPNAVVAIAGPTGDDGDGILENGEEWIYTADYTITQEDLNTGSVTNQATVMAMDEDGTEVEDLSGTDVDNDDATVTDVCQDPSITIVKTAEYDPIVNGECTSAVGDIITYTFSVTNTGNVDLTDVTVTDPLFEAPNAVVAIAGPTGDDGDGILENGEEWIYTADYTVTQTDLNTGSVTNQATATGTPPVGDDVSDLSGTDVDNDDATVTDVCQDPSITIVKTAEYDPIVNGECTSDVGDTIAYTFSVTNTGNVDLTDVTVTDPLFEAPNAVVAIAGPTGDDGDGILENGEEWIYTADYTVTQEDLNTGSVTNQATATGTPPVGDDVSDLSGTDVDNDDATVTDVCQDASIALIKTGTFNDENGDNCSDPGETISYAFTVVNTGNVLLTDITITDDLVTVNGGPITLDAGATDVTTFTATYAITQLDIDAGLVQNQAIVTGTAPLGTEVSDLSDDDVITEDDPTITSLCQDPAIALIKTGMFNDENGDGCTDVNETISYSFTVINMGNVLLNNITITDDLVTVNGGPISLAAGVANSTAFTATYTVTQADIDAGFVENQAEVSGTTPSGVTVTDLSDDNNNTDDDPTITMLCQNASIALIKEGTVNDIDGDGCADVKETITYSFTIVNTGNVTLTNIDIDDDLVNVTGGPIVLAPGASDSTTFTAVYSIRQSDIDRGFVENQATGSGLDPNGTLVSDLSDDNSLTEDDPTVTQICQSANIALIKTATPTDENNNGCVDLGETIVYDFVVTNLSNVVLTNVTITDPLVTVSGGPITLAAGASDTETFTAVYTVVQANVDDGFVSNQATVSGETPSGTTVTDLSDNNSNLEDDPTVTNLCRMPMITLEKTGLFNDENLDGSGQAGETITYLFKVTNTGSVTLFNITLADPLPGITISGGPIAQLDPGQFDDTTFTATYTITEADVANGEVINQATVTGEDSNGVVVTDASDDPNDPTNADPDGDGDPDDPTVTIIPLVFTIADFEIFNGVTPNEDGLNDFFNIFGIENFGNNNVKIFNRWGVLVFETNNYGGSDGQSNVFRGRSNGRSTIREEKDLPTGTYFYILNFTEEDDGNPNNGFENPGKDNYTGYLYINR